MGILKRAEKEMTMDLIGFSASKAEMEKAEEAYNRKAENEQAIKSRTGLRAITSGFMNGASSGVSGGLRRLPHQPRCVNNDGYDGPDFD